METSTVVLIIVGVVVLVALIAAIWPRLRAADGHVSDTCPNEISP